MMFLAQKQGKAASFTSLNCLPAATHELLHGLKLVSAVTLAKRSAIKCSAEDEINRE